jgi:hypothetical protein
MSPKDMEKGIGRFKMFKFCFANTALLQSKCGPNVEEANDFVALTTQITNRVHKVRYLRLVIWMPM